MTAIRSHQWLELHAQGAQAREAKTTRLEERELLLAVASGPVRMVDLFRRLRVGDSGQFQDLLSRVVGRGWLVVHETNPGLRSGLPAALPQAPEDEPAESALEALLARYKNFQEEPESADAALPNPASPPPPAAEEPSLPSPSVSPPPYSQGAMDDWMAAMGLAPAPGPAASPAPSASPPTSEEAPPLSGAHADLMEALSASRQRPPVVVPAYGLGGHPPVSPKEDPGFVRLKDVGAVRGPGDGPASEPKSTPPKPDALPAPSSSLSTKARRQKQQNGREQFLAVARRNAAAREDARLTAQRLRQSILEQEERERAKVERQRQQEDAVRRPSIQERAERARKIRDGLPPES